MRPLQQGSQASCDGWPPQSEHPERTSGDCMPLSDLRQGLYGITLVALTRLVQTQVGEEVYVTNFIS